MFKKNPFLPFFFSFLIALFSTTSSISFASSSLKELWKSPVGGRYTFFILPQADGTFVHVDGEEESFSTTAIVYRMDIMNINQKGQINKKWSLSTEKIFTGKNGANQYLVSVQMKKGIATAYDLNGKKIWEYKAGSPIKWEGHHKDTTYLRVKDKIVVLSSAGKPVGSFKCNDAPVIGPDGSLYVIERPKENQFALLKYNKLGKLQWKANIPAMQKQKDWSTPNAGISDVDLDISDKHVYVNIKYAMYHNRQSLSKSVRMIYAITSKGKVAWTVKTNIQDDVGYGSSITLVDVIDYKTGSLSFEGNVIYFIDNKGNRKKYFETKDGGLTLVNNGFLIYKYKNKSASLMSLDLKTKWTMQFPKGVEGYIDFMENNVVAFKPYDFDLEEEESYYDSEEEINSEEEETSQPLQQKRSYIQYMYVYGNYIGAYESDEKFNIVAVDEKKRIIYIRQNKTKVLQALQY
ncbi:hypothetical protein ACPF7I_11930 [Anoxybacillus sp. D401a]|uniref:hypothetical protein n=1 Tax=Anoxybacillus sp. D401a TaxID=575112 RepID=UPI003D33E51F